MEGFVRVKEGYQRTSDFPIKTMKSKKNHQKIAKSKPGENEIPLRPPSQRLVNRKAPESLYIYVFLNGNGIKPKMLCFTPIQLKKGMPWFLEQIAVAFNIYAKYLVRMDGITVANPQELINRGAYIVIAQGEKYRDTWYYLPRTAKDTSEDADQSNESNKQADEKVCTSLSLS